MPQLAYNKADDSAFFIARFHNFRPEESTMPKQFKPSDEKCSIRILWLCFPFALFFCLSWPHPFTDDGGLLNVVILVLTVLGSYKLLRRGALQIIIDGDFFKVYDAIRKEIVETYRFSRMIKPCVHDIRPMKFLTYRYFSFEYGGYDRVYVDLSLYSVPERVRLSVALVHALPDLQVGVDD